MRKIVTAGLAALTMGATIAATATPADAQPRRYYPREYRHDRGDRTGTAIAAGVVGLALGAALAGNSGNNRGYYGAYSYGPNYYRGYSPRICETSRWVFDPYIGRRVLIRDRYRC